MIALRLWLTLAILLLGVVIGFILQDELYSNTLLALAALTLSIPYVLVITIFAITVRLLKIKVGMWLGFAVVAGYASLGSIFLFLFVGSELNSWEVDSTLSYVARAVPVLDKMKAQDGSYPRSLPVSELGEPPYLLKNYGNYSSNGSGFRFEYEDEPASWAGGEGPVVFDSSDREWEEDR